MHSLAIIILVGVLLIMHLLGLQMPFTFLAGALAVGVLLVGLPHGGLDQRIGLRLLQSLPRPIAITIFLGLYLSVAAVVIAGWIFVPSLTIVSFFALSAWHFGLEEESRTDLSPIQRLCVIARGGMVIWIPTCFRGPEITELLNTIVPVDNSYIVEQIVGGIQVCMPLLVILVAIDLVSVHALSRPTVFGLSQRTLHRVRVLAFAVLFATVNPIISFGVYFCGWHSICGLAHLRDQFQFSNRELAWSVLPISLAAIALFAVGFAVSFSFNSITPATVQTVFIGLSAVAVPHLLLHVISDSVGLDALGAVS